MFAHYWRQEVAIISPVPYKRLDPPLKKKINNIMPGSLSEYRLEAKDGN